MFSILLEGGECIFNLGKNGFNLRTDFTDNIHTLLDLLVCSIAEYFYCADYPFHP